MYFSHELNNLSDCCSPRKLPEDNFISNNHNQHHVNLNSVSLAMSSSATACLSTSSTTTVTTTKPIHHDVLFDTRERQRQRNVNQAFATLRCILPTYPPDKKLSKHEILRLSIKYIRILETILKYQEEVEGHSAIPNLTLADSTVRLKTRDFPNRPNRSKNHLSKLHKNNYST